MMHRRLHLLSVLEKAHEDDEKQAERDEVERELEALDAAIANGMATLAEDRRKALIDYARKSHPELAHAVETGGND